MDLGSHPREIEELLPELAFRLRGNAFEFQKRSDHDITGSVITSNRSRGPAYRSRNGRSLAVNYSLPTFCASTVTAHGAADSESLLGKPQDDGDAEILNVLSERPWPNSNMGLVTHKQPVTIPSDHKQRQIACGLTAGRCCSAGRSDTFGHHPPSGHAL